ncbi:hypothetical protein AGMMS49965_04580 [Bacteroidia bacterium]|nr:hypothetical protein AGMMS49965_04580 [Bacteroidia bacterium]
MRYLIDTNIFLFMVGDKHSLSRNVSHIIDDYSNLLYISSESVKELIHLFQANKISDTKWKVAQDIVDAIENDWNVTIKYIQKEHLVAFSNLDRVENHNDPSDRLIISQAICEKIPLISSDNKFRHYRKQHLELVLTKNKSDPVQRRLHLYRSRDVARRVSTIGIFNRPKAQSFGRFFILFAAL